MVSQELAAVEVIEEFAETVEEISDDLLLVMISFDLGYTEIDECDSGV